MEERTHTDQLKELDTKALEEPTLVNTVAERLANLSKITSGVKDDSAVSEDDSDDSTPVVKDDSSQKDDTQAELEEEPDDSTPAKEGEELVIPEGYIRAAIHQGWDKDVVDDLVKNNPELAKKALENLYISTNNASREWSAIGRAKIEQDLQPPESEESDFKGVDVEKLKKEYEDSPLIEGVIIPLNEALKKVLAKPKVSESSQQFQTATARANMAANAAIDQRINNFFGADVMKPYEKFYGKLDLGQTVGDLANGQQLNRLAVLQEAEFIMTGIRMRGGDIDVEKALEKAHFIVTEPIREQVIRESLKTTATQRKNSMLLRPSQGKRSGESGSSGKPKNREELISNVTQKLSDVFSPR